MAMMAVSVANANIASQGYVDQQVGTRQVAGDYATNSALGTVRTTATNAASAAANAQSAAEAAQSTADDAADAAAAAQTAANSKLPTATYNAQVGTVNATNMGTTATTVVTAIKEVSGKVSTATNAASTAQAAAEAAQDAADDAAAAAKTAQSTASAAQTAANGKVAIAQGTDAANKAVITNSSGNVTTGTISSGMIADDAVTSAKIGTGAVANDNLANSAVTSAKIADGTIVNADISASAAIAASKISGLADVATSGSYDDLTDTPTIPTVNNATLTIQKNGATVDTFTANASANKTINITVPTTTSQLTNNSGFITSDDLPDEYVLKAATADALGGVKSGGDISVSSTGVVTVNNATNATNADHADTADTATTATSATKATQDGSGNVITSTYATKTELSGKVATAQGTSNANDVMVVNSSGNVAPALITNANISSSAAIAQSKISGLTTALADKLDKDGTAARATADASGNNIASTYATKSQITALDGTVTGSGAVVTDVSQTDGKVSVTKGNVKIPVGGESGTTYATIWVE